MSSYSFNIYFPPHFKDLSLFFFLQSLLQRGQGAVAACQAAPRTRPHPPWRLRPLLPHLSESPWVLWVGFHVSSLSYLFVLPSGFLSVTAFLFGLGGSCRSVSSGGWSGVQMDPCQPETHLHQMLEWGLWCLASTHHTSTHLGFMFRTSILHCLFTSCGIFHCMTLNNFNALYVSLHAPPVHS